MQEKNLYTIWENLKPPVVLYTPDNLPIIIYHCGKRNRYSGPDYLNCIVEYSGQIRKGSVEIHLSSSDWFLHGHHLQQPYSDIILHIVAHNDLTEEKLNLIPAPTALLETEKESANDLPETFINSRTLSLERLRSRIMIYSELLSHHSVEHLFQLSVFKACGYPVNQHAFAQVCFHLSGHQSGWVRTLFEIREKTGSALFLLYYGNNLLTKQFREKIYRMISLNDLHLLKTFNIPPQPVIQFKTGGIHPSNHPLIKLEQLYFYYRYSSRHLNLSHFLYNLLNPSFSLKPLLDFFLIPRHYQQILDPGKKYLLSRNRLCEWLVTDCIPLFMAVPNNNWKSKLKELYFTIPAGYQPSFLPPIQYAWQLQAYKAHLKRNENCVPEY